MIHEYEYRKYKIEPCEIEIATGRHEEHPQTKTGYIYIILDVYMSGDHESDEWYDTGRRSGTWRLRTCDSAIKRGP